MSKIYNVRFNGTRATIKLVCNIGDEIVIKSLVAKDADELWQGMLDLEMLEIKGQTIEFIKTFDKTMESINLAKAISDWEARGNMVRKFPMSGKKLRLTEAEEDDILNLIDLGDLI